MSTFTNYEDIITQNDHSKNHKYYDFDKIKHFSENQKEFLTDKLYIQSALNGIDILALTNILSNSNRVLDLSIQMQRSRKPQLIGWRSLGESFKHLPQLISLGIDLEGCNNFQEEETKVFVKYFKHLINLRTFCIKTGLQNYLGENGIKYLYQAIKSLTNLEYLSQEFSQGTIFGKKVAISFAQSLQYHVKLTNLKLIFERDNFICNEGAIEIGRSISKMINLNRLHLYFGENNSIQNEGMSGLGDGLRTLTSLEYLFFFIDSKNNVNDEGLLAFSKGLKYLHKLLDFDLSLDCSLFSENLQMEEGFQGLESLIKFTFTKISESLQGISLGKCLAYLNKLQYLDITNLKIIKGKSINGDGFEHLSSLRYLKLNINLDYTVRSEDIQFLSQNFSYLKNLEELKLTIRSCEHQHLVDKIFIGIGYLSQLLRLSIFLDDISKFEDEQLRRFRDSCKNLINLKQFYFHNKVHQNKQEYDGEFREFIQTFKNVESLTILINCWFYSKNTQTELVRGLTQYDNLKQLNLQLNYNFNPNNDNKIDYISQILNNNKNLNHLRLELSQDKARENSLIQIGNALLNLKGLLCLVFLFKPSSSVFSKLFQIKIKKKCKYLVKFNNFQ